MKEFARLLVFFCGVLFALPGFAAGVIEKSTGQVSAGPSAAAATAITVGQRITAGTTLRTGPKSTAVIRFDDGQAIALNENSEFRVAEYSFSKDQPAKDRFGFDLIRGALRSVTAAFTRRNPRAYTLHTATVTMGVRGTDFMVAIVNPVYMRILNGSIEAINTAGAMTFNAGDTGIVTNENTLGAPIPLSSLPAGIQSAFGQLATLTFTQIGSSAVQNVFNKFPSGGDDLAASIAAMLIANPGLADDVALIASTLSDAQQSAAGKGMGEAIKVLTTACSTQACSAIRVHGPGDIAHAVRMGGTSNLKIAADNVEGGYLNADGEFIPPAEFLNKNRDTITRFGLCTGSPC